MANKLQNIKAVKQLLAGEHKSQRKTQIYTGKLKTQPEDHEVVERFEDGKPKVWIERDPAGFGTRVKQHDGFQSREPENSILKDIQEALTVPDECPSCGTEMRNDEQQLNFKFYFTRKKCFSCVLQEERKLKQEGPEVWEAYQNKIMKSNAESWFKDVDKEVEIVKNQVVKTWQNAQGEFGEADMSDFLEKLESDYKKLKNDIRKQFK
jgi:hypothetical protein